MKWTQHPILTAPAPEAIKKLCFNEDGSSKPEGLKTLIEMHRQHEEAIANADADPLNFGVSLEGWVYADEMLDKYDTLMVFGGNRCLAGEQEIYDPVQQKSLRVDEIEGDFHVLAWDAAKKQKVSTKALAPFRKPPLDLFQVRLGNGEALHCSNTHQVLSFGSYSQIAGVEFLDVPASEDASFADLPVSDGYHLLSTLDIDHSTSLEGVRRLMKTAQDSQWNYSVYFRQYDGQLHLVEGSDQDSPPSPDDVLEYISCACAGSDGSECKSQYNRFYLRFDPPSTLGDLQQSEGQSVDTKSRSSCKPCKISFAVTRGSRVS
jgi:hypothetical protein